MSRREVRALKEDQTEPEATLRGRVTRSGKVLVETTNFDEVERDDTAAEDDSMEELRTCMEELQRQAWTAIRDRDEELRRVSGESERVSSEARGVLGSLRDLTGSGPSSMTTFFNLSWNSRHAS